MNAFACVNNNSVELRLSKSGKSKHEIQAAKVLLKNAIFVNPIARILFFNIVYYFVFKWSIFQVSDFAPLVS